MDNYLETNYKEYRKHFSKLGIILLVGAIVYYVSPYLGLAIMGNFPVVMESVSFYFAALMLFSYAVTYTIIFLLFKLIPKEKKLEKKKMKISHVFIGFFICYAAAFVCNMATNRFTALLSELTKKEIDSGITDLMNNLNPAVTFLIIVIIGPILEELLFRKCLIDRTIQYGEGISIVFSGVTFGLFHGNISQVFYTCFMGMCLAFIYCKTGNIKYSILIHIINNGFSWIATLVFKLSGFWDLADKLDTATTDSEVMNIFWDNIGGVALVLIYLAVSMIFVVVGVIMFFTRKNMITIMPGEKVIPRYYRFITLIGNVGMILYVSYFLVQIILNIFGIV